MTAEAALDALKASVQRKLEECIRNVRRPKEAWDILAAKFSDTDHPPVQGFKIGHKLLNLNEPPKEGEQLCHVMLKKDNRHICLTQCLVPPLVMLQKDGKPEVPHLWTVYETKPPANYLLSGLGKCYLHPVFENPYQRKEWGRFLIFLQKHNRVAAVRSKTFDFYILPPQKDTDYSYVVVLYHMVVSFPEVTDQVPSPSGRVIVGTHVPGDKVVSDSTQNSAHGCVGASIQPSTGSLKSESSESLGVDHVSDCHSSQVSNHATHCSLDKFGRSSFVNVECNKSLQRVSNTQIKQNSPAVELSQIVREISPQASREVDHQSLKMQDGCLQRNFIQADPTYLRTLSQSHSGWIFGAIVELVDNSRDAKATSVKISVEPMYSKKAEEMIPVLSVVDDGHGMSHIQILRMLSLGHKQPYDDDPHHIGRFGVGFKTGAMRLGRDALVLTQTTSSRSVALLSQSFNEGKDNIEIPIVSYCKRGNYMEVDTSIHSEEADVHLSAIKEFSPLNEYSIGQKLGLFDRIGTGTQIYIWNLDKWGSDYSLEWHTSDTEDHSSCQNHSDILIRSRRIRSRPGQISHKVLLDYSLRAYLEVIFLEPRMKIYVQDSLVKCRPLKKFLNKTALVNGNIMGIPVQLTLGCSKIEWEQMNCGMFLYWHGRLIEAYKRVGGMVHNADMGRGVIGVIDVTDLMSYGNGYAWVHCNKQGFQDCEQYAKLEEWLGNRADEYWDANFDDLHLKKGISHYKPDCEWVQCDKCRKWRKLSKGFDSKRLPAEWFCFMPPFEGKCEIPELVERGVITVGAKRSRHHPSQKPVQCDEDAKMDIGVLAQAASLNTFPTATQCSESHQEQNVTKCDPSGKLDVASKLPNTHQKPSKRKCKFINSNNVHGYKRNRLNQSNHFIPVQGLLIFLHCIYRRYFDLLSVITELFVPAISLDSSSVLRLSLHSSSHSTSVIALGSTLLRAGYNIGHEVLNVNEPPTEGELCHYVILKKDDKTISRVRCLNPPAEVFVNFSTCLRIWTVCEIKPVTKYSLSGLPSFFLSPEPRNTYERKEWCIFSAFLQKNNRVAVVPSFTCDFYILPQHKGSDYSHVEVLYRSKVALCESNIQGPASQDLLQKTMTHVDPSIRLSSCSLDCKKLDSLGKDGLLVRHASHVCHQSMHCLKEEFGDSSDVNIWCNDSLLRDSSACVKRSSTNVDLPQIVNELSPQESREGVHDQKDACLKRNFIRADPTYLRTLSQAHSAWIFGAVAELVDNSRDAKATRLNISIESLYSKKATEMIPVLSFVDDGHGMSHVDVVRMLSFGHKQPDGDDPDHIGRFGIGFKTGAMSLGQDAIVLMQTTDSRSVALLSQSFNEAKDNVEIPIVSYCKKGNFMEVDTCIHSEEAANCHLKAIKEFSPFNEYSIGQKLGLFDEMGTGTQIYIWNLAKWGSDHSLEWLAGKTSDHSSYQTQGDILVRSKRIRSRPGQISQKVPLDYSLQAYLEVIFLEPRMKIYVQGSLVKSRPLAKSLNKTVMHGWLIEAYKRVGGMVHNADMGRGVIGVIDVMDLMNDRNGQVWVHSNKQGFQDCEPYPKLEDWLGNKSDEYWDANFDVLQLAKGDARYMPDHEWVQCDKCRKWRILNNGFDSESLPAVWFCYMPPFNGECRTPEQNVGQGIVILASKRGHGPHQKPVQLEEGATVAKRSRHGPNQVFRCEEAANGASNFPVGADLRL
ncbi:hypothetical protein AAC387_Pa03g4616 [Persea americana]